MKQFHPLTIERFERETRDSLRIALAVPDEFENEYEFLPGQHLPFEIVVDGKKIRRTYSICSAVDERPLEIGVRIQPGGVFSEHAASQLAVGDTLDAMPPGGRFHAEIDKSRSKKERQRLERHLKRFVLRGSAKTGEGAWVDPQLEALQAIADRNIRRFDLLAAQEDAS